MCNSGHLKICNLIHHYHWILKGPPAAEPHNKLDTEIGPLVEVCLAMLNDGNKAISMVSESCGGAELTRVHTFYSITFEGSAEPVALPCVLQEEQVREKVKERPHIKHLHCCYLHMYILQYH